MRGKNAHGVAPKVLNSEAAGPAQHLQHCICGRYVPVSLNTATFRGSLSGRSAQSAYHACAGLAKQPEALRKGGDRVSCTA